MSQSTVIVYINDTRHALSHDKYIHMTLAEFNRLECKLKGVKIGWYLFFSLFFSFIILKNNWYINYNLYSSEGGCGACTLMISKFDTEHNQIKRYTVNSCITPILSLHGCQITTVEGLGDAKNPHSVQVSTSYFYIYI